LPNEQTASSPVNVAAEATLQESVIVPVYPYVELIVTVDSDVLPGLIDAGLAAPAEIE